MAIKKPLGELTIDGIPQLIKDSSTLNNVLKQTAKDSSLVSQQTVQLNKDMTALGENMKKSFEHGNAFINLMKGGQNFGDYLQLSPEFVKNLSEANKEMKTSEEVLKSIQKKEKGWLENLQDRVYGFYKNTLKPASNAFIEFMELSKDEKIILLAKEVAEKGEYYIIGDDNTSNEKSPSTKPANTKPAQDISVVPTSAENATKTRKIQVPS
ncbi:hypothetical protein LJC00_04360, partial [Dysgonomonas sp. OttesenSCG-928-M03]|nr:hypothetical protein [Dysgonomonas sp. OttesenSCG-928-M03]